MDQKDSGSGETGVQYSFVASGIIMGYMIEEQLLCKHNVQTSFPLPTGICTLHYRHPRRHRHVQTKTEHIFIQDRTYSFDLETGLENTHTHTHARTHRVQFSSRWYLCARKAHMRSTPSLRGFHNVAYETVSIFV